ncbi:MAG: cell division protein FtsQ/DivIB [Aeromicrobium sp.]
MSEQRFAQRRSEGRWLRIRRYVYATLFLILAAAVVWLIWFSAVLGVRHVQVKGQSTLDANEISTRAEVARGEPLAKVDTASIESRIAGLERVEEVQVTRSWPNTITINIVERESVAWILSGGAVRGLDRFGVDFRSYGKAPKGLFEVRVTATDSETRHESLVEAAEVVNAIHDDAPDLFGAIRHVNVASKDSVELILDKNRTVRWGSAARSRQKLRVLEPLLDIRARTYDVTAPEQPTTKK